jgi:hypothetical protein
MIGRRDGSRRFAAWPVGWTNQSGKNPALRLKDNG